MSREDPWVCPICGKGPCVCTSFRHRVRELVVRCTWRVADVITDGEIRDQRPVADPNPIGVRADDALIEHIRHGGWPDDRIGSMLAAWRADVRGGDTVIRRAMFPREPFRVALILALGIVTVVGLAIALRVTPAWALLGVLVLTATTWPYALWLLYGPPAWPSRNTPEK